MADTKDRKPRVEIDYSPPPRDFFFAPGVDRGLWTVQPLPSMYDTRPLGRVAAASVAEHAPWVEQIESHIATHFRRRTFKKALVLKTVPVVLKNLSSKGHFLAVNGKYLLTGAAGTRLRNRYAWYANDPVTADGQTAEWFAELQAADPVPPLWEGTTDGLDFVIDARNPFNFYHFATEALCLLCCVDHDGFAGRIFIHCDRSDVKPFIQAWVDDLFPRLVGRVTFLSGEHRYDRCLSVLNARHLYYQSGPSVMDDVDDVAPQTHYWKGRNPDRLSLSVLAMNSCDEMLLRLRETALRRIEGRDWSHLPRRFWVGRKSNRVRPMDGEDALTAALAERGFQVIYFEDYSPLEQVALMARAEIMMSYHGAGFANMLFAAPETHCIEIGHYQTCLYRWPDFMPHTIVSGCRYSSLFADFNVETAQEDVEIRSRPLLAVRLGNDGRRKVLAYVDAILGHVREPDPAWLGAMAEMLSRTGDNAALERLLDGHPAAVEADPDLLIFRANLHLDAGDERAGRLLLERAWEATGDRPFLLERLILLYDRAGITAPWAKLHRKQFPDRSGVLGRKLKRQRRTIGNTS